MNAEAIRELLRRQPFDPFQIRMTNGDVHTVRHPELIMIVGGRLVVGYPEADRIAILSLLHVSALETARAA